MFLLFLILSGLLIGVLVAALIQYDRIASYRFVSCLLPRTGLSGVYFLILASGFAFSWLVGYYPPSGRAIGEGYLSLLGLFGYFSHLLFLVALVALTISGFLWDTVPNSISKPGVAIGLLSALFVPGLAGSFHLGLVPKNIDSFLYNTTGAAVGFGLFWAIAKFYKRFKNKEGMGEGCIKLAAMLGAFLGPVKFLAVMFLSSLIGSFIGIGYIALISVWTSMRTRTDTPINYSGLMAATGVLVCFVGDSLINIYTQIHG